MKKSAGRKHLGSLFVLFSIFLGLSACMPLEREANNQTNEKAKILSEDTPINLPEHISYQVSDHISVDAQISYPKSHKDYTLDRILLKRQLFQLKDIVKIWGDCNQSKWTGKQKVSDVTLENGEKTYQYYAKYKKDQEFIGNSVYFLYNSHDLEKGTALIGQANYRTVNGLSFATNTNLDFKTIDEAEKDIKSKIKQFGINDILEDRIQYTVTLQGLKKAAAARGDSYKDYMESCDLNNITLEKNDEMYQFIYRQGFKEIPFMPYPVSSAETENIYSDIESGIYVLYGQKGISFFQASNMYDFHGTKGTETILAPGKLLDIFCSDQEKNLINQHLIVKEIKIAYLPKLKDRNQLLFEATPVWCFVYEMEQKDTDEPYIDVAIYDALNGRKCE